MFVVDRSALAVLLPLALLLGVAVWSNHSGGPEPQLRQADQSLERPSIDRDQTVAANFPSR
jgi:hypothetical protein